MIAKEDIDPSRLPAVGTRVLITGITGQDGYYLAELLASRGCDVIGAVRPAESEAGTTLCTQLALRGMHPCELEDAAAVDALIAKVRPQIIYHLAAQSSVRISWELPLETARTNGLGTLALLEAVRRYCPEAAFVMAGSCDCYDHEAAGAQGVTPTTPFKVTNPYAASKVLAHQLTDCYREEHGLRAAVAIFFNHTSPRRPDMFVERGIVRNAVRVKLGLLPAVPIGSWETTRDWSWAPELMVGFAALGALPRPRDLVLAGGRTLTVRDWVLEAFRQLGLDADHQVVVDPSRLHAGDRPHTFGNIELTHQTLGWRPQAGLTEMVRRLIEWDLQDLQR